jgi:hypothetical protein
VEHTLYDSHNDLGFGEDTEILIDIDYTCHAGSPPGWEDPGESPECIINGCSIMQIITANDETINWSTLCPEKKKEVTDWACDKADTAEVHDSCFENQADWEDSYRAEMDYEARKYGF